VAAGRRRQCVETPWRGLPGYAVVAGLLVCLSFATSPAKQGCTAFAPGRTSSWAHGPRRISKALSHAATRVAARGGEEWPLSCATEQGKSLEELLRARLSKSEDFVGTYRVTADKAVVGAAKELGEPPFLAELPEGAVVNVIEVVNMPRDHRVRGLIDSPVSGWISLLNTRTGFRWAERQGGASLEDFDTSMDEVVQKLCEDMGEGCDVTSELTGELQDRLRSDVLYLSVVRKYDEEALPLLPTFEGPKEKPWAMSGDNLEQFDSMAKDLTYKVELKPVLSELRGNIERAILKGRREYSPVLDAYKVQFMNRVLGQPPQAGATAAFDGFLRRFAEMRKEVLASVGGSGGLPTRNRTSTGTGGGRQADEKETMEWLAFFAMLHENTRISQADSYFGHALFGLCLRRLVQRFELERTMGTLPELADDVRARIRLEMGLDKEQGQKQLATAQFAAFAEEVCKSDSDTLAMVLSLSKSSIGAIRRQTEYVFGRGLRDEIAIPMNRASDEIERKGSDASVLEATSSFMLEAAAAGELRMLSTSPAARERLAWDAILYGALLQSAEDATPAP